MSSNGTTAHSEAAGTITATVHQDIADVPNFPLTEQQQIQELLNIYTIITEDFITHLSSETELPESGKLRIRHMLDYNILGGKYWRAILLLNTIQTLYIITPSHVTALNSIIWKQSLILAWCIEILQAMFLVADDIMDGSITRRGKPCWYKQEYIQLDAINDSLILESLLYYLINKNLSQHKYFINIIQLYQNVSLYTQMGQMYDLTTVPPHTQNNKNRDNKKLLNSFNLELYERIVTYKTALYTIYLSIAAGMILCEYKNIILDPKILKIIKKISIEIGKKFQIEDDYLDCFGESSIIGKIGTDIRDFKCSWLIVQALLICNNEQRVLLEKYYGNIEHEDEIKNLYNILNLKNIYNLQEDQSYERINNLIQEHSHLLPPDLFLPILNKIHKRIK